MTAGDGKLVLSLFFGVHDSCITISDQEKILLHLEAERVFRIRHLRASYDQMQELIYIGLKYLGKAIEDVETVLLAKFGCQFSTSKLKVLEKGFSPIITSHHANHIGTTVPADFDNSLIVCADGGSEDGCTKIYLKNGNEISPLVDLSETILNGRYFGTLTQIVIDPNFYKANDLYPGKTMGLAALGSFSNELYDLISKHKNDLNLLYEDKPIDPINTLLGISNNYSKVWLDKRRCDLAYTAQKTWCDEFLEEISKYKDLSENICLVGGCALNVVLNSMLSEKKWFKNVYISPVSGDGGQSLGAILFHFPYIKCGYPFLGRGFGELKEDKALVTQVTRDLLENKIVAWYQGRSEIGARALGHRSFLGLPASIEMRKRLSEQVKGREPYRPVAALITEEFLPKFAVDQTPSPFMTFAPKVFDEIKRDLPAIVHYDGTSRVQTLKRNDNPVLYEILTEIEKKTGYPVLMNSSFNIAGEPIVDTPEDAQVTFRRSHADVLYTNGKRFELA